jgi:CubicO group peptidase (beta-lactamase class C family)
MSIGDGYRTESALDSPYDFVRETIIERETEAGTKFSYSGLNTFVLAWLVEEITNMPFQDAVSKEIWYHIGAEADASFLAPRNGIAVMHGGFMAKMRDLIRFGMLFTPSYGLVSDKKIISDAHIDLILNGGNPKLLQNLNIPGFEESDIKHNIYQWDQVYDNDDFFKGGWAGQGLLINPTRDIVAVFTGYKRNEAHHALEIRKILREVLNGIFDKKDQQTIN